MSNVDRLEREYVLQRKIPNTFVRNELRSNMTNLPDRWVDVLMSNYQELLSEHAEKGDRIIRRCDLKVMEEF